jgi:Type VI secretion system VasI, EvfG, VC_A0118
MSSELHTNFFLRNLDWTIPEGSLAEVSSPSLKDLMKSESLLVELTPYSESPIMTSFDVRGLTEAIKPLQAACPWK